MNFFFFRFSLTEREKADREHKKQLLQIAQEHEKARELERVQRYRMPQDMKKGEKGNSADLIEFFYCFVNLEISSLQRITMKWMIVKSCRIPNKRNGKVSVWHRQCTNLAQKISH